MKNKLKYLLAVILIAILTATSAIYASAEEYESAAAVGEEGDTEAEISEGKDVKKEAGGEENFFGEVYEDISAYLAEILCALTFAGSLILAVAYKKGLLPLMKKSLLTIGNAINKIKETAKESADQSSAVSADIIEKLTASKEIIDTLAERVEALYNALNKSIKDEESQRREKRQLSLVMNAQTDMLYDVFMSSALPQYQKDAVGEKIAKMKEAIAENDCEE